MIYLDQKTEDKLAFENLLTRAKTISLDHLSTIANPSALSGAQFETIVYESTIESSVGTKFEGGIKQTIDRAFPDIVAAGYFGIEVKATKKDNWTSIGNSVLESSRIPSVEKIYMFFGKLGGEPDISFRNYEECIKDIAVTHYPRYTINMLQKSENSIFQKMGVEYDELRMEVNPIKKIREYYRGQLKEGQELWWLDDEQENIPGLSPIIKSFSTVESKEKDEIKAEIFINFPEILSKKPNKYAKVAPFLAANYGIVSWNLRDHFTSGGQVEIKAKNKVILIPQIVSELIRLTPKVKEQLRKYDQASLKNFWRKDIVDYTNAEQAWKQEADHQSLALNLDIKLSELYEEAGLNAIESTS